MHLCRPIARRRNGTKVADELGFGASSSSSPVPTKEHPTRADHHTRHSGPVTRTLGFEARFDLLCSGPGTSCLHHQLRVKRFSPDSYVSVL